MPVGLAPERDRCAPLRLLVLDDHPAVRLGLERLLAREPGLSLCDAVADESGLWTAVGAHDPHLVLIDYDLDRGDGLTICQRLKQRPNPPAVLIYSAFATPALAIPAALAQADGLVDKIEPFETLLDAIRGAGRGEWVGARASRELLTAAGASVDPADLPVLAMFVERVPPAEIAIALGTDRADVLRRAQRMRGRLRAERG